MPRVHTLRPQNACIASLLMLGAVTACYLLSGSHLGVLSVGDPLAPWTAFTRFSWSVFAALLVSLPVFIAQWWDSPSLALSALQLHRHRAMLLLLLAMFYVAWRVGVHWLWPLVEATGGDSNWVALWLGLDALSILLKIEVVFVVTTAVGLSGYYRELRTCALLMALLLLVLMPPYAAGIALLLLVLDVLWYAMPGAWKTSLLLLPAAMVHRTWVEGESLWGVFILVFLFLIQLAIVKLARDAVAGHAMREIHEGASAPEEQSEFTPDKRTEAIGSEPVQLEVAPRVHSERPVVEVETGQPACVQGGADLLRASEHSPMTSEATIPTGGQLPEERERLTAPRGAIRTRSTWPADPEGAEELLTFLERALHSENMNVRCQAIGALGELGMQNHVHKLASLLEDDTVQQTVERMAIIEALGRLGGDLAVMTLLKLNSDPNLSVRWRAEEVLDILLAGDSLPISRRVVRMDDGPLVSVLN